MAKRKYSVFGSGVVGATSSNTIQIDDGHNVYLRYLVQNFPKVADRAINHAGYVVHAEVKAFMSKDKHGKPLNPLTASRGLDRFRTVGKYKRMSRVKKFAGDTSGKGRGLYQAVNFKHFAGKLTAVTGWGSREASKLSGVRFQAGSNTPMTYKMKRFFYAIAKKLTGEDKRIALMLASKKVGSNVDSGDGISSKSSSSIKNPARNVFTPVYNRVMPKLGGLIERRMKMLLGDIEEQSYNVYLKNEFDVSKMSNPRPMTFGKGRKRA